MVDITRIAAMGIIGAILSITIKKHAPEFSVLVAAAAGILIFLTVCQGLEEVVALFISLSEKAGIKAAYLAIVIKAIGIAYITEFAVRICMDAKENAIAANVELAGKILVMVISAPIIAALLDKVSSLLG